MYPTDKLPETQTLRLEYPESLPICEKRRDIVAAIKKHQVIIVAGETGSGKTTQLPKMCLEAGLGTRGKIGCTQPRRIAALSVSKRIAEELDVAWGDFVGCKIRFADKTRPGTKVKVMTDGILLAETRSDPKLSLYEAIIIDEAHERSLNIDFLLGYLKRILSQRPDLKLVITSATIDTKLFSEAFGNAPIFEVSGRSYPVDVRYAPLSGQEDEADLSYVEGAVSAVEDIITESSEGDVLVFMPSERDIRETREKLAGRFGPKVEVLPLMGSLSAGEQERVFQASAVRKVIVATNIAETSLTIPNIRYVVDTGLARVSRYNPRTRTKRLPIEPIARSSANQRSGRAGRVRAGICVRLYSEDDFDSRPAFADPEIARTNLAEVILQMKAFNLGEIESFPFLQAPDDTSIRSGYTVLHELGAIDAKNSLTELGRELARLPVDPTIGRMLLQSRRERCVREVGVIAAGLSIQDPRERPLEKREKAEESHKKFRHPDSDFLTLLNVWNDFQHQWKILKSSNQVRKYCKANFISFLRMREWTDIYEELMEGMDGGQRGKQSNVPVTDTAAIKRFDGNYRAIHRSILSGILGQVAFRIERNTYRGWGGRELVMFPGSTLFENASKDRTGSGVRQKRRSDPSKEQWIVAGEVVETSRNFARTVAPIAASWIEEVGQHLVRRTFEHPQWSEHTGTVSVRERITLGGLLIAYRMIDYARIDAAAAKDIFIRSALLPEDSKVEHAFVKRNRRILDKVASRLARAGQLDLQVLHERLVAFYDRILPALSSVHELKKFAHIKLKEDTALFDVAAEELMPGGSMPEDSAEFPDELEIGGGKIELAYRYEPGGDRDGVTLKVPLLLARHLPSHTLDAAIPGIREQQVIYLLRGLPKKLRSLVHPIEETSRLIAKDPEFVNAPLSLGLADALKRKFGVDVPPGQFDLSQLPDHLRPRIEVTDGDRVISSGRSFGAIQNSLPVTTESDTLPAWESVRSTWERPRLSGWEFGDLPEAIEVTKLGGVSVFLYPGIVCEGNDIALRLFDLREVAVRSSRQGIDALLKKHLAKEFQDLEKQSKQADSLKPLITLYTTSEMLRSGVLACAAAHMFERESAYPLRRVDFESAVANAKQRIPNLVPSIIGIVKTCLELRQQIVALKNPYTGMRGELDELLSPDFLEKTPYVQLQHFPRYLKAMLIRSERARGDPVRDRTNAAIVRKYSEAVRSLGSTGQVQNLYWMVEELKVSTFAQELGTAHPISPARLDKAIQNAEGAHSKKVI